MESSLEIRSVDELRQWLTRHHHQTESVWLVTHKKHTGDKYVSVQEVLDELVCFGWIDGRRKKLDTERTMQLISQRKSQHWSKSYKDRVARLTKEGRMHTAGLEAVARAKASGMWDFLNDVDALVVPEDLVLELAKYPDARGYYEAFPDSAKRDILRWIKLAKRPATRQARIQKAASLASRNERASGTK